MKRFFLILVSMAIILFFVGFNYLIWDRESKAEDIQALKNTKDINDITIDSLTREIKRLNDINSYNLELIQNLKDDIALLEEQIETIENVNKDLIDEINKKNENIDFLKSGYQSHLLEEIILSWIGYLNEGNFAKAYSISHKNSIDNKDNITLEEFTSLFKDILSIEISSIKEVIYDSNADGQRFFHVEINVTVKNTQEKTYFENGINNRIFIMDFDEVSNEWAIIDLLNVE